MFYWCCDNNRIDIVKFLYLSGYLNIDIHEYIYVYYECYYSICFHNKINDQKISNYLDTLDFIMKINVHVLVKTSLSLNG